MIQDLETSSIQSGLSAETVEPAVVNSATADNIGNNKWKRVREALQDGDASPVPIQDDKDSKSPLASDPIGDMNSLDSGNIDEPHANIEVDIKAYVELEEKYHTLQQENEKTLKEYEKTLKALQHAQADSQNNKRIYHEKLKYERLEAINAFAPLVDSLEAASLQQDEGIQNIRDLSHTIYKKLGVIVINPTAGEAFDPTMHSAVATEVSTDSTQAPNTIIRVLRKGYCLHERIMRPAMVVINGVKE
jgi:molecular chaperone GrpE